MHCPSSPSSLACLTTPPKYLQDLGFHPCRNPLQRLTASARYYEELRFQPVEFPTESELGVVDQTAPQPAGDERSEGS